ncbi:MAG: 50S ribosomal protein L22 [Gemmataceae bacterium]|nr:50S ribosomal protein L22 [Gemmataceae bacterium]MCS7271922.1 50S ribosomal protein L22 [Gemmataceae bacterium]MDW8242080.1 50S ribosomal protein L22 [Thermogemmata sp.]
MPYTAKHRFADMGPRKIRPFANLVRGRNVNEALELLSFYPNRGAKLLAAVIKSAYSNAEFLEHPDPDELIVLECRVDGAPMYKRIQPRARGTAFRILRRLSHITVTLMDETEMQEYLTHLKAGGVRQNLARLAQGWLKRHAVS